MELAHLVRCLFQVKLHWEYEQTVQHHIEQLFATPSLWFLSIQLTLWERERESETARQSWLSLFRWNVSMNCFDSVFICVRACVCFSLRVCFFFVCVLIVSHKQVSICYMSKSDKISCSFDCESKKKEKKRNDFDGSPKKDNSFILVKNWLHKCTHNDIHERNFWFFRWKIFNFSDILRYCFGLWSYNLWPKKIIKKFAYKQTNT